jgi:hypothetical protein
MKKTLKDILILLFIIWIGYSVILNVYVTPFVKNANKEIKYAFIFSVIPDKITFVNFEYKNLNALFLTADIYIREVIKKDYDKFLNGVSIVCPTLKFVKNPQQNTDTEKTTPAHFNLPFCQDISIFNGKIIYEDREQLVMLKIDNINGRSKYFNKGKKDIEYLLLEVNGALQKRKQDKIILKVYFFPYYKNRFNINIFGTKIRARSFEPLFSKYNLKVESGEVDFLIRIAGEMRKIYLNNAIQIRNLKIKEDIGIDFKALLGVSYEQIGKYLTDSNGNLYVNFDFMIPDTELSQLPALYSKTFAGIVGDRIKTGVITAPIRQVTDLIWNLTGENIFRIFKIFGGE